MPFGLLRASKRYSAMTSSVVDASCFAGHDQTRIGGLKKRSFSAIKKLKPSHFHNPHARIYHVYLLNTVSGFARSDPTLAELQFKNYMEKHGTLSVFCLWQFVARPAAMMWFC